MERKGVVMRMAKLPRECARAAGWMREIEARVSAPENHDTSISSCKRTAKRCKFRSVSNSGMLNQRKPKENCSGPENRDASIFVGKYNANAHEFSTVFEHLD